LQVSKTVFYEVKRLATEKLREAFAEDSGASGARTLTQPVPASSSRGSRLGGIDGHGEEAKRQGDLVGEKVVEK
jgi:hypothetical protein